MAEQTAGTGGTQLSRKIRCLQRQRMRSVSKDEQESRAPLWQITKGSVAPSCLLPNVPVFHVYGPGSELGKEAGCSSYPALRAKLALHPKPGQSRVRFLSFYSHAFKQASRTLFCNLAPNKIPRQSLASSGLYVETESWLISAALTTASVQMICTAIAEGSLATHGCFTVL